MHARSDEQASRDAVVAGRRFDLMRQEARKPRGGGKEGASGEDGSGGGDGEEENLELSEREKD